MKFLAALSVRRPVSTLMVLMSVLILGLISLNRLPLAFLPDVDFPAVFITVPYANSSPQQIEDQILKPLEENLATLAGVKDLDSQATADEATLSLFFNWGQSLDVVRMKVVEKIEEVRDELPADADKIFVNTFSTTQIPVVEARISAPGIDLSQNYELLETRIVNRIRRIPGVAKVDLHGVKPREVWINLRLYKIAEHGIDIGDLADRLIASNQNLALGEIRDVTQTIHVRSFGAFENLQAIEDFPVGVEALTLSDVADITYREPPLGLGRHLNGRYAVALSVFKESAANTVDVAQAVTEAIEGPIAQDPTLSGINLLVFEDQAKEITAGLDGLRIEGLIGGLLAMVVLFLFLQRLDTTFIVSLSIPTSIIATAIVLFFMGKTLNVLSMMGLMLGVGLLVDDAIVVLESIFREHSEGKPPSEAAIVGARQVSGAVVASTLTTAIVFLPTILGEQNQLTVWLSEIGTAISLTILCSLIVSMTLIPLMASRFLKNKVTAPPRWTEWLAERYVAIMEWSFAHRAWSAVITVAILASIVIPFSFGLETAMFAGLNQNQMQLEYDFKDFHYKEDAEAAVDRVEAFLFERQADYQIDSIYSYFAENEASTTLTFEAEHIDEDQAKRIRDEVRESLPTLAGVELNFTDDDSETGGNSTYFRVNLYGEDSRRLATLADEVERRLSLVSGVKDSKSSAGDARREIRVALDREMGAKYGLSPQDLADIFAFSLGGRPLRRFQTDDKEVELILTMSQQDVSTLEDLKNFTVSGSEGRGVTLGTLAAFEVVENPKEIRRKNRKTLTTIRASYEGEDWDEARTSIEESLTAMNFPTGYSWSFGSRIQQQDVQLNQMLINYLMAIVLIYIVMAAQFESFVHPFAILFSIPFALWGTAWFLWVTDTPFNFMAQIGVLVLMGIVVKNGIVLLDHINHLRREGLSRADAIRLGGRQRLRPILMTAATAVLALVPMALGQAALDGLYYFPLARAVIGGLTASTLLTLVILPFIYVVLDDGAGWVVRLWTLSTPTRDPAIESVRH